MKKKLRVVMLPINEKALGYLILSNNKLFTYKPNYVFTDGYLQSIPATKQHLYFLSDEEIKGGDWCIMLDSFGNVFSNPQQYLAKEGQFLNKGLKKIIATTDSSYLLGINDRGQSRPEFSYLPQPPQSFIEEYIKLYNKGKQITEVMIEYEESAECDCYYTKHCKSTMLDDKTHCRDGENIKQILKINSRDNTITIKPIKDSWNREEVINLLKDLNDQINKTSCELALDLDSMNKWIKENL